MTTRAPAVLKIMIENLLEFPAYVQQTGANCDFQLPDPSPFLDLSFQDKRQGIDLVGACKQVSCHPNITHKIEL